MCVIYLFFHLPECSFSAVLLSFAPKFSTTQCQNWPSLHLHSLLSPPTQLPPALAPSPLQPHPLPPRLLAPSLRVGTMLSGRRWPTERPHPAHRILSATCPVKCPLDSVASRTIKCYWRGASHHCPPCCWGEATAGATAPMKQWLLPQVRIIKWIIWLTEKALYLEKYVTDHKQ